MKRRAWRRWGAGAEGGPAGSLQTLEVAEQHPVRLGLNFAVGQEADGLLDAAGVAIAGTHEARGQSVLLVLLLLLPGLQVGHGHLQDVGLLLFGVGLLPQKLRTQEGLQLLDAGVDAVPTQFLYHWFSQLKRKKRGKIQLGSLRFNFSKVSVKHKCKKAHGFKEMGFTL